MNFNQDTIMEFPDFEKLDDLFLEIRKYLPSDFGKTLPPKLKHRYINLILEIKPCQERVKKFKVLLEGKEYYKPTAPIRPVVRQEEPLPNLQKLDSTFSAMNHSFPDKYEEMLPEEYLDQYYRVRKNIAHLHAKSLRLLEVLQRQGLL